MTYFVIFIVSLLFGAKSSSVPTEEVMALFDFYTTCGGTYWNWYNESTFGSIWNFTGPITDIDPCGDPTGTWQGVDCISLLNISCKERNAQHCHISSLQMNFKGLQGSFPDSLCNLSYLEMLDLSHGNLTGDVSSCIGNLQNLSALVLSHNSFHDMLPSSLYSITKLTSLRLENNLLTGHISSHIGQLADLIFFHAAFNSLSGPLPEELWTLTKLMLFTVEVNYISGSISDSVGQLSNLVMLDLDINMMTGTLPSGLGELASLRYMPLGRNYFHGSIPSQLGKLQNLLYVGVGNCMLSGTIPTEIFDMASLQDLNFIKNALSGTLPTEIGNAGNLQFVQLYNNRLEGSLPSSLGNLEGLLVIQIQNNKFTGHLGPALWQSSILKLNQFDASGNQFSGIIPSELFNSPQLETASLSTNCFHGSLPQSLCNAKNLRVLSLNSLSASSHCKNAFSLPGSKVLINEVVDGTVPKCLFTLPNISTVHMSGNGLYGSIDDDFLSPRLLDLSLSHNHFSGTIPLSIKRSVLRRLDLSYNIFSGDCVGMQQARCPLANSSCSSDIENTLTLEVNRLSGRIPNHIATSRDINILDGNMFSCSYLPSKDPSAGLYTCGSNNLKNSFFLFSSVFGTFLAIAVYLYYYSTVWIVRDRKNHENSGNISCILSYFRVIDDSWRGLLPNIWHFDRNLRRVPVGCFILIAMGFCCCFPIYVLKILESGSDDNTYSTHKYSYWWTMSMVNTTGVVPATIVLIGWALCATALAVDNFRQKVNTLTDSAATTRNSSATTRNSSAHLEVSDISRKSKAGEHRTISISAVKLWRKGRSIFRVSQVTSEGEQYVTVSWITYAVVASTVNFIAVFGANGLYIYCIYLQLPLIQQRVVEISFAAFGFVWNFGIVPAVVFKSVKEIRHRVMLKTIISAFNSVAAPCLVTAFSDAMCFQGLFVLPDPISSQYLYDQCMVFLGDGDCLVYAPFEVETESAYPPFQYNYGCSSQILKAYVPVYIFIYSFILFAMPIGYWLFPLYVPYSSMPSWIQKRLPSILWPYYESSTSLSLEGSSSVRESESEFVESGISARRKEKCDVLIKPDSVFSHFTHHMVVALTFGLCSPPLALSVIFVILLQSLYWRVLVGRYIIVQTGDIKSSKDEDISLTATFASTCKHVCRLEKYLYSSRTSFELALFPIIWCSAIFFAFLCWDIAGDQLGWKSTLWIPITTMSFPLLIWVVGRLFDMLYVQPPQSTSKSDQSVTNVTDDNNPILQLAVVVDSKNDDIA